MREVSVLSSRLIVAAFFILTCIAVLYIPVSAQASRSLSNIGRRLDELNRQSQKAAQDELNHELRGKPPSKEELKQAAAKKFRVIHDLEGLQNEYNEIVLKLQTREPLSDHFVIEAANNIHKYSTGLRNDIPFPETAIAPGAHAPAIAESPRSTKALLLELCSRIHSFVTSAMFDSAAVLDIPVAEKARKDLDDIMRLSDHLRHLQTQGK